MAASAQHSVWCVRPNDEAYLVSEAIADDGLFTHSFVNSIEFSREKAGKFERAGFIRPFPDGMRFDPFENYPWLSIDARYHPDFFSDGVPFVSPKLLPLLDQPAGSLQALHTWTEWRLGEGPDWSYLWLSYIPLVPVLDLDRSEVEVQDDVESGQPVRRLAVHPFGRLVLRDGLAPPCGLFRAAEYPSMLLATDAVAEAVLRAGCFGIDFREVETVYTRYGALRRRGLHGVELHPHGVYARRENRQPVPDA